MAKALYIVLFLIVAHFTSFAQNSINDYKYIIVPKKFDFLKEADLYQVNSLTKFLFNKYGYEAYMQDEDLPEDLRANKCLALISDVVKEGNFLKTKLRIDLKDCIGNVVYSSPFGESREKEYSKAYNLALRDAFKTFQNLDYAYQPNEKILSKATSQANATDGVKEKEEIARLKEEIKNLKEEQIEDKRPSVESKKLDEIITTISETKELKSEILYAQPIDNGYQIVDTTPKKVMVLHHSGVKDVFTVEGKKAIVYKKGDIWMYSESGDILKGEIINIKF